MKVIIVGCGRVGAELAALLHREGHDVTMVDLDASAFTYLPEDFGGTKMVGNGIDQDVQRRAGIEEADAFISATRGDNRNAMACQMAKHIFGVSRVVSRIFDPIREEMYRGLGIRTINPTRVQARLLKEALEREEAELAPAAGSDDAGVGDESP
jgi:trk system potassium uptake protein TrkA